MRALLATSVLALAACSQPGDVTNNEGVDINAAADAARNDIDAYAASFALYSEYHANIGAPGGVDAGAGQRYVTVPVQIYARIKDSGMPVYQIGSVALHRTGDIDGATAEQKSWHLHSVDLKPAPANAQH